LREIARDRGRRLVAEGGLGWWCSCPATHVPHGGSASRRCIRRSAGRGLRSAGMPYRSSSHQQAHSASDRGSRPAWPWRSSQFANLVTVAPLRAQSLVEPITAVIERRALQLNHGAGGGFEIVEPNTRAAGLWRLTRALSFATQYMTRPSAASARMPEARSAGGTIFPRLENETHHEPDHDDHGHQTEEDDALPYLGTKIVRLFADDSHVGGIPSVGSLHSCSAKGGG
jgi:hypothetical protein